MRPFILIKKLFLTAIEEIKRISGIECPYMNAVVNVGGMAARGPPLLKKERQLPKVRETIFQTKNDFPKFGKRFFKRKMTSQSSGNDFSNEK